MVYGVNKRRRRRLIAAITLLALAGCQGTPRLESHAGLTVVAGTTELPAPQRSDLVAADRPALIGPLDTVTVEVFNLPELTRELQVDASGRVSMPLIGQIDARGRTAQELAKAIEDQLRARYVRDPSVIVNIKNSVSQVVTVDGQVTEPGLYPVTNQLTLMRAVASAKGLTEFARVDDVVVLRTVGGQRMAALYNLGAIRRGAYGDPAIYANDVIIVGDSYQRRLFRDFLSLAPLLSAPLIALVR